MSGTQRFRDRLHAADLLAKELDAYRGRNPLVLAIPRGAVPMAARIAAALQGELDVVLVHKLGAPGNPEFAVGAVEESGWCYVADYAASVGASAEYIEAEKRAQLEALARRRALYTPIRAPADPAGRIAIIVDDGLATGATMVSALHAVRARCPERLVCAVPVASEEACERVRRDADEVVCLLTPANFMAVGQFYDDFRQVDDDEVVALLRRR